MATQNLLSVSGGCPDILLVEIPGANSLPTIPLNVLTASGALEANKPYHIHAMGTAPLEFTLPACTTAGDKVLVEVAAGNADVTINKPDGSAAWAVPGPNPQAVVRFVCDGSNWKAEE